MKRYISPFLKLLLILAFLSRLSYVYGQPLPQRSTTPEKADTNAAAAKSDRSMNLGSRAADIVADSLQLKPADNNIKATTLGETIGVERLELKASPKAFSASTNLSFVLKQSGAFKLEILNMQGVVVTELSQGNGQAGEEFVFQFKKGNYPTGGYIARLVTTHEVTSVRFVLN